jgi:hypothetical protein
MRTFLHTLAATATLAALLLGAGVSTALAAPVERYTFDDAWCFDFGSQVDCSVTRGTLFVTTNPDGGQTGRIQFRENTVSYDPTGVQIGTFKTWSFARFVYAVDRDGTFVVDHFRADGPYGACHGSSVLKIVDFEVRVAHQTPPHYS